MSRYIMKKYQRQYVNIKMTIIKCIEIFVMTIIGTLLSLSLMPIIVPLFTVFYIISLFAMLAIKIKYGNRARKATGPDVLAGKETAISRSIINVALRFSGAMDVKKFRTRFTDMLQNSIDSEGRLRYQRMMQIYCKAFGYTIWKDPDTFNIEQHVKVIKLEDIVKRNLTKELDRKDGPSNAEYIEALTTLKENEKNLDWKILMKCVMNEIGMKKFNAEIPQWQLLLLKESDDKYTALFRFHHAIADGVYISRMLCEGFLDSPIDLFHSYVQPSKLKMLLLNLWSFSLFPFGLWKIMKNKDNNILHGPKLSGKKKFYLSKSMPLDTFRNIRERSKVGTHSVLFSCLSTALASHFKRRSAIVNDITTLIPMPLQNLRKPIKLRNRFAVVSLKVPTPPKALHFQQKSSDMSDTRKDCCSLDRLQMIKAVFQDAKMDPTFLSVHSLIIAFCSFLPTSLAEYLLTTKGCTVAFSNMPGPETEIYFDTDRIEDIMFWNPDRDPLGTGMSVLSYNGQLRVGLVLDEALLKDETEGNLFLQDFENEIDDILHELDNQQNTELDLKSENAEFLKIVP